MIMNPQTITKQAKDIKPGEYLQGKKICIVDVGKSVTIIHFQDCGKLPLKNENEVLLEVEQ